MAGNSKGVFVQAVGTTVLLTWVVGEVVVPDREELACSTVTRTLGVGTRGKANQQAKGNHSLSHGSPHRGTVSLSTDAAEGAAATAL